MMYDISYIIYHTSYIIHHISYIKMFLEIFSQTLPEVPPPYAHAYKISLSKSNSKENKNITENITELKVNFEIEYIFREGLSNEEILAEGFSENDDYHWEGVLPAVWLTEIESFLAKTSYQHEVLNDLYLKINDDKKTPENLEEWQYFVQELVQAIYEKAAHSLPLLIRLRSVETDKNTDKNAVKNGITLVLEPSFVERKVIASLKKNKEKHQIIPISWEHFGLTLQKIYQLEYLQEKAREEEPQKNGFFIDNGQGFWYEEGKSFAGDIKVINEVKLFLNKNINALK